MFFVISLPPLPVAQTKTPYGISSIVVVPSAFLIEAVITLLSTFLTIVCNFKEIFSSEKTSSVYLINFLLNIDKMFGKASTNETLISLEISGYHFDKS